MRSRSRSPADTSSAQVRYVLQLTFGLAGGYVSLAWGTEEQFDALFNCCRQMTDAVLGRGGINVQKLEFVNRVGQLTHRPAQGLGQASLRIPVRFTPQATFVEVMAVLHDQHLGGKHRYDPFIVSVVNCELAGLLLVGNEVKCTHVQLFDKNRGSAVCTVAF